MTWRYLNLRWSLCFLFWKIVVFLPVLPEAVQ